MQAQKLESCIKEIRKNSGISTLNEEDAKRRIILRILALLGWDIYSDEIRQEHGVGTRRVDYALQVNGENKVFIEAKKPGEDLDNHQKQLLDYSFEEGVALAILTNGTSWWFYLPLKQGAWNDRRFYSLDILVEEDNVVGIFDSLLSRENVGSGKAVQHAESILERRQREKTFGESLPEAWNRIIKDSEPNSLLVDLLKETTEDICGFRLEKGDVSKISQFICSHQEKWLLSSEQKELDPSPTKHSDAKTENQTKNMRRTNRVQRIQDVHYELKYAREILVNTANWLIDKGSLKLSDCPINVTRGGKQVLINDTPAHPSGSKFRAPRQLKNDLYIECHNSFNGYIEYSRRLLKKYGYDPELLKVE